ncbi:MAG: cob(I)alamin adenosyltransferase [Planctomycetota bacterium]|jgi:cob(I)alamin adenosyltransferase
MIHLNKIYTRSGDDGTTGLGDGTRVQKHHERIAAYGTTDELSSVLGLALAGGVPEPYGAWIQSIQNDLFDVGSDLCRPGAQADGSRLDSAYTKQLEDWIDEVNEGLTALTSFILPGGSQAAAWMHLGRTVCRRAERHVNALLADSAEAERVNVEVLRYLNRLSDLMFVLSRVLNNGGKDDILWVPAKRKQKDS